MSTHTCAICAELLTGARRRYCRDRCAREGGRRLRLQRRGAPVPPFRPDLGPMADRLFGKLLEQS